VSRSTSRTLARLSYLGGVGLAGDDRTLAEYLSRWPPKRSGFQSVAARLTSGRRVPSMSLDGRFGAARSALTPACPSPRHLCQP
jgi:hypothetical protein